MVSSSEAFPEIKPKALVIARPDDFASAVLASAVLRPAREALPQTRIFLLIHAKYAPLYVEHPALDGIFTGQAVINEEQADQLKLYFKRYLDGDTMASAARAARLPLSTSTYPHLFSKKEYVGTDYYPAIIEESYQEKLVSEWQKRKSESPRLGKTHPKKGVKVYKEFRIAAGPATGAFKNSSSTDGKGNGRRPGSQHTFS